MTFSFEKLPDLQLFTNKNQENTISYRLQEPKMCKRRNADFGIFTWL